MRVLVTGSTGGIGQSLIATLRATDPEQIFTLNRWSRGRQSDVWNHLADLNDVMAVRKAVMAVKPDVVIHLAANASIRQAISNPMEALQVNVMGTAALIESCKEAEVRTFILASSAEVYGAQSDQPLNEESLPVPTTNYALAKLLAEGLLKISGLPYVIMRPFNTYGAGGSVVDTFIERATKREGVACLGDWRTRDFLFIADHVRAYLSVLARLDVALGHTFCFCTGTEVAIETVGSMIATGHLLVQAPPPRDDGMPRLVGNPEKARRMLGWEPLYSLDSGIKKAVEEWKRALPR